MTYTTSGNFKLREFIPIEEGIVDIAIVLLYSRYTYSAQIQRSIHRKFGLYCQPQGVVNFDLTVIGQPTSIANFAVISLGGVSTVRTLRKPITNITVQTERRIGVTSITNSQTTRQLLSHFTINTQIIRNIRRIVSESIQSERRLQESHKLAAQTQRQITDVHKTEAQTERRLLSISTTNTQIERKLRAHFKNAWQAVRRLILSPWREIIEIEADFGGGCSRLAVKRKPRIGDSGTQFRIEAFDGDKPIDLATGTIIVTVRQPNRKINTYIAIHQDGNVARYEGKPTDNLWPRAGLYTIDVTVEWADGRRFTAQSVQVQIE